MLIKNVRIVTFDENNRLIENGFIRTDKNLISEIGSMAVLKEGNEEESIDAAGKTLIPGFICTHSHIYSAFARGMIIPDSAPSNFLEILEKLWWRMDKKLTHEDIYYSAMITLVDCIQNGVTCLFDHHAGPNSVDGSLDVIEKAFKDMNMRGTLCYEVSDRDGTEIADKGIRENSRFIKKTSSESDDMVKGIFGLHASFTLSDDTLRKASEEGNKLNSGFHIHAAEGKADYEKCMEDYNMGVIERLNKFNIMNSKTVLAHCIHIKENEKELLKLCNVVHNPESNMNNAVGCCDVLSLLDKGITVGLGSDGFNSNHFRAMDTCYVLHKHERRDPRVMSPYDVIKLGIINNGKIASKYFKNPVGAIKVGSKADLILIDYDSPTPVTSSNIYGHMIFGMNSSMISDTIINGKIVMKDRKLIMIDEKEIMAKSREISEKLWERI